MSFLDYIVEAIIQVMFVAGIVFFIDRILSCCRGANNHPIPIPQSSHYAVRSGPHVSVPNPM